MKLESASFTHIGRRDNNEDACCVERELGLFAVADGMGGYAGGEVASRLAITALTDFLRRNAGDDDVTWPYAMDRRLSPDENLLRVGTLVAGTQIAARRSGALAQMGSTLASLLVRDGVAVIGHVGDSRVYRLRGGALSPLTTDHSWYAELLAAGAPDLPPRAEFAYPNVITRALGTATGIPDLRSEPLAAGDRFLLCTDGLFEALEEARLAELLARDPVSSACRALVEEAYARGARDNITAVVLACYASSEPGSSPSLSAPGIR